MNPPGSSYQDALNPSHLFPSTPDYPSPSPKYESDQPLYPATVPHDQSRGQHIPGGSAKLGTVWSFDLWITILAAIALTAIAAFSFTAQAMKIEVPLGQLQHSIINGTNLAALTAAGGVVVGALFAFTFGVIGRRIIYNRAVNARPLSVGLWNSIASKGGFRYLPYMVTESYGVLLVLLALIWVIPSAITGAVTPSLTTVHTITNAWPVKYHDQLYDKSEWWITTMDCYNPNSRAIDGSCPAGRDGGAILQGMYLAAGFWPTLSFASEGQFLRKPSLIIGEINMTIPGIPGQPTLANPSNQPYDGGSKIRYTLLNEAVSESACVYTIIPTVQCKLTRDPPLTLTSTTIDMPMPNCPSGSRISRNLPFLNGSDAWSNPSNGYVTSAGCQGEPSRNEYHIGIAVLGEPARRVTNWWGGDSAGWQSFRWDCVITATEEQRLSTFDFRTKSFSFNDTCGPSSRLNNTEILPFASSVLWALGTSHTNDGMGILVDALVPRPSSASIGGGSDPMEMAVSRIGVEYLLGQGFGVAAQVAYKEMEAWVGALQEVSLVDQREASLQYRAYTWNGWKSQVWAGIVAFGALVAWAVVVVGLRSHAVYDPSDWAQTVDVAQGWAIANGKGAAREQVRYGEMNQGNGGFGFSHL